jgi:uncharacterized protein YjdB
VNHFLPLDGMAAFQIHLQGNSFNVLHYNVLNAVSEADIEHLYNVRVRQYRNCFGTTLFG